MKFPRRGIISTLAGAGAAAALTVATAPAALADTHNYSEPTPGVTCDELVHTTLDLGRAYKGRCFGNPVGISRGYKYREEIKCDYQGASAWVYGPWKSDGSWSTPTYQCPDTEPALKHHVTFAWV